MAATQADKQSEEFGIFVQRFMHFMNLWTVYRDLRSGHYLPTVNPPAKNDEDWSPTDIGTTIMFVLYAFFYSLIEDEVSGLNGFRVWRQRYPEEENAIAAVEAQATRFKKDLRLFRNRLGFHGSRTRAHEASGLDLFVRHSGTAIFNAMKNFKALGSALLGKDNARQGIGKFDAGQVRQWIDSITQKAQEQTTAQQ